MPRDLLADAPRDLLDGGKQPATTKDKIISSVPVRVAAGAADPVVGANALYDKVVGGAGQFLTSGAGYFPNPVSDWFGQAKNSGQRVANQETQAIDEARMANGSQPGATDWARVTGNILSPANAMLAPARGAGLGQKLASGLAIGASQPVNTNGQDNPTGDDYTLGVLLNSGAGAATSGVLHSLGSAAKTPEQLRRASQVKALQAYGVQPTIGQAAGGTMGSLEEQIGSVPIAGHFIKNAQVDRPKLELNRGTYQDVLSSLGETVPHDLAVGRPALAHVNETVSGAYDRVLPKLSLDVDAVAPSIQTIVRDAKTLPAAQQEQLNAWVGKVMDADNFTRTTGKDGSQTIERIIPGDKLKGVTSDIRKKAFDLASDASSDARELGQHLFDLHDAIMGSAKASNPQAAQELKAVDAAYTKLIRVNKAASSIGATDGVFTPAQLHNAVLASVGKRQAAKASGKLPMQEISDAAKTVLSAKVPNSGTVDRTLVAALLGAMATNPALIPKIAAAGAGSGAAYTRTGQALMGKALDAPTLADALRKYAPKHANTIINAAGASGPYATRGATALLNQ